MWRRRPARTTGTIIITTDTLIRTEATAITTTATDSGSVAVGRLFDVLSWMSPAWPIGAFAHSGGLEWATEAGDVHDRESVRAWILDLVGHGPIHNELILFRHAHAAAQAGDGDRLCELAELALASATGAERRLESVAQGGAFRRVARATVGATVFAPFDGIDDDALAYPIAAACLMAGEGVPLEESLAAFAHGVAANLVSAAQRLVPLGQTDGQRVLRDLKPMLLAAAACAAALPLGNPFLQMAGMSFAAELGCMAHETQYTRLFRT